jgi:hypothetical protein
MAKYYPECQCCGKEFLVQLAGPTRDRQWKLDNWTWVCDDCKEAQKLEASAKAAAQAEAIGLPELTGTEKQIRWAEVLRLKLIAELDKEPEHWNSTPEQGALLRQTIAEIKSQVEARFWIDNRANSPWEILKAYVEKNPPRPVGEKALEVDAAIEATVRPTTVASETVAEVRPFPDRVEIAFPEKREDFWQLIKKELRFTWTGNCWTRKITMKTGAAKDRAAEAGNRILAAGFPIRIYDEEIRQAAIDGDYEPECGKWVQARTSGQYTGWFVISWSRDSGDFYQEAKRLPATRYDKPSVVVPAEHFEEVLDFAEVHGFTVSPGALELAEKAKALKESALIATPKTRAKMEARGAGRPVLIPIDVEIPDALKD